MRAAKAAKECVADFHAGTRVVVHGRAGKVEWDGRPEHPYVKVLWDDDGQTSQVIPAKDVQPAQEVLVEDAFCECKGSVVDKLFEVTIPLLKQIIDELCTQEPQKRGSTLAVWLLEKCSAPPDILESLRTWNEARINNSKAPEATVRAPPHPRPENGSPKIKTALRGDNPSPEAIGLDSKPPVETKESSRRSLSRTSTKDPEKKMSINTDGVNRRRSVMWKTVDKKHDPDSDDSTETHTAPSSPKKSPLGEKRPMRRSNCGQGGDKKVDNRRRRFTTTISQVPVGLPPKQECRAFLRNVPAFSKFSDQDLDKIIDVCVCKRYEPDENVLVHGAPADTLHVVVDGLGKVSTLSQVGTVKVGDCFGEDALRLSASTNPSQVSAVNGSITTLSVSTSAFQNLEIQRTPMAKRKEDAKARKGHSEFAMTRGEDGMDNAKTCQDSGRPILQGVTPTKEEIDVIKLSCANNKMLSEVLQLSDEQCSLIAESLYAISLMKGEILFQKGDHALAFYIIREGYMDVHLDGQNSAGIHLQSGSSFGELSLLYDSPRSASLKCSKDNTTLWVLPRQSFKQVAALSFQTRVKEYSEMLGKIPAIRDVFDAENLDMLADVIEEVTVYEGDFLCEKGKDDGILFIIYSGECVVSDQEDGSGGSTVLKKGDWLGEQQVLEGTPSNFTVRAVSDVILALVLDDSSLETTRQALKQMKKLNIKAQTHISKEKLADKVLEKQVSKSASNVNQVIIADSKLSNMERMGTLGEGSFGSVVLLREKDTDIKHALKAINKDYITKMKMGPAVQNERSVMSVLDSNFIVRLFGSYQDEENIFFLLEPVLGGELYDIYNDHNFFGSIPHARFWVACAALGLEHMHQKRVIYRDLKLENCLLDDTGYVKLTDMGIAKIVIGKTYTICGTADYFAPETLRQAGHNRAVDWWALGVLLFIMVVGRSPFDAEDVTQIYKNIVKGFSKVNFPKSVTSDLSDVIKSLCRKKPEERVTMQKGGVDMFKEMPWFSSLDWTQVFERQVEAPYIPGPPDLSKFATKTLTREFELDLDKMRDWDGAIGEADD